MRLAQRVSVISSASSLTCCRRALLDTLHVQSFTELPRPLPSTSSSSERDVHASSEVSTLINLESQRTPAMQTLYDARSLVLSLISHALEDAGLEPGSLQGQNISMSLFSTLFDKLPASAEEADAVSGLADDIADYFGFTGPTSFQSAGRNDPAHALRQGMCTIQSDGCRLAIVGAVSPSCSHKNECHCENGEAPPQKLDGEADVLHIQAVILVLRAADASDDSGDGRTVIRSLVFGRTEYVSNDTDLHTDAHTQLLRHAVQCAGVGGTDIGLLEFHGISQDKNTLEKVSHAYSSKIQVRRSGHSSGGCEMLLIYYGILRALSWFNSKPPTQCDSHGEKSLYAQVLVQHPFGSMSSIVLESPSFIENEKIPDQYAEDSNALQLEVDNMIRKYGGCLTVARANFGQSSKRRQGTSILLTGANGGFGCHVLSQLLANESVELVICLIRGNAWGRLSDAFFHAGYESGDLRRAEDTGRLAVFQTLDLAADSLGCSQQCYAELIHSIDTIVHLAWKIDYNLPVSHFENHVKATRNLAELCILAQEDVTYYFISSFSAYAQYHEELIPEAPLSPNVTYALDQGYSTSKLIAEHVLFLIHSSDPNTFKLRVVRIGQIGGNSLTGKWNPDEMVPMMIQAAPALRAILMTMPDVQWIPSDICAMSLSELVVSALPDRQRVLHLANPDIVPWPRIVDSIARICGLDKLSLLSEKEYIELLGATEKSLPVKRLLPFLHGIFLKGGLPRRFTLLDVASTVQLSRSLAECPSIEDAFLQRVIDAVLERKDVVHPTSLQPVLLFGPWTKHAGANVMRSIADRVLGAAEWSKKQIGIVNVNPYAESSLATLMSQLSAFEKLKEKRIVPSAVLGYCLGEYAAAVVAGAISIEIAVDFLIRRSVAFNDVDGRMLNVFSDIASTRKLLLRISDPPDIGILSGPWHCVLSGTSQQIEAAHKVLIESDVKAKLVESAVIPFHSSALDGAISALSLPDTERRPSECAFISGLLGQPISGERLGPTYWLRHMRDRVHFVDAMRYVQTHFSETPLVDMGPGPAIASMVSRYEWDSVKALSVEEVLSNAKSIIYRRLDPVSQSANATVINAEKSSCPSDARNSTDIEQAAASILASSFGFNDLSADDLLSKSFLNLGLQSLDFINFSIQLSQTAGRDVIPFNLYASELPISEVLRSH